MGRNFYQLVAIDENKKEYVIELKNRNNQNKGHLSLIDYGTSFFKNEEQMRNYFIGKKENFPRNCEFKIKYLYDGEIKYLTVIYDEPILKDMLRNKYLKKDNIFDKTSSKEIDYEHRVFSIRLFEELEKLLKDELFLKTLGLYERNILGMSNILNQKIQESIHKYAYLINLPVLDPEEEKEKTELRFSILRELGQYKQFRTLYLLIKSYKNGEFKLDLERINEDEEYFKYRQSNEKKENTWDFTDSYGLPPEIKESYEKGGMDEVYSQYDLDDLMSKGLRR